MTADNTQDGMVQFVSSSGLAFSNDNSRQDDNPGFVSGTQGWDLSGGIEWSDDNDYLRFTPSPSPQMGWVCPKCDKVYSPYVTECGNCNGGHYTFSSSSTTIRINEKRSPGDSSDASAANR